MSSNQPFLGVKPRSDCFPLGFQGFVAPPYPWHNLPLFDGYSGSKSHLVPLEKERYEHLVGSRESIGHELFEKPAQISTGFEDTQAVIKSSFSGEQKRKNGQPFPLHSNPDCNSSSPKGKKKRKVNTPEDLKDDKYWNRRQKNNLAAKKWRDAKRLQCVSATRRVIGLETENVSIQLELIYLREQNEILKRLICQTSYPTM